MLILLHHPLILIYLMLVRIENARDSLLPILNQYFILGGVFPIALGRLAIGFAYRLN